MAVIPRNQGNPKGSGPPAAQSDHCLFTLPFLMVCSANENQPGINEKQNLHLFLTCKCQGTLEKTEHAVLLQSCGIHLFIFIERNPVPIQSLCMPTHSREPF